MKADSPLFSPATDIELAKGLLDDALKRLEANEPGNAIVLVHSAMKELLRASQGMLHPMKTEYHRLASKEKS